MIRAVLEMVRVDLGIVDWDGNSSRSTSVEGSDGRGADEDADEDDEGEDEAGGDADGDVDVMGIGYGVGMGSSGGSGNMGSRRFRANASTNATVSGHSERLYGHEVEEPQEESQELAKFSLMLDLWGHFVVSSIITRVKATLRLLHIILVMFLTPIRTHFHIRRLRLRALSGTVLTVLEQGMGMDMVVACMSTTDLSVPTPFLLE